MRKQTTPTTARALRGMIKPLLAGTAALWLASCATNFETSPYTNAAREAADYVESTPLKPSASPQTAKREPSTRAAEERPGLATGYGESIRSEWNRQSFVRAASSPAGTGVVYYNDREGFEAMAGYASRADALKKGLFVVNA